METPNIESLSKKSITIRPLLRELTLSDNIDYLPSMHEYLANIYILINIFEFISQALHYKMLQVDPDLERKNIGCLTLYRYCRDASIITNSDRNFMVSFSYMRNTYCHRYQDVTVNDVYDYTITYRNYILHMVEKAEELLADISEDSQAYLHIVDLYNHISDIKYNDILTSAMYTLGRVLTLKECIEIKKMYDRNDATLPNVSRLLMEKEKLLHQQ
ncbi:hypothetical protein [Clostridium tertium]|uniref:hypothetical protein n=1 Tax=Clostridium tertium TaxID=1559 RepID=UPI0023B326A0|nr:hypothetical protein [Clostridium tertium]